MEFLQAQTTDLKLSALLTILDRKLPIELLSHYSQYLLTVSKGDVYKNVDYFKVVLKLYSQYPPMTIPWIPVNKALEADLHLETIRSILCIPVSVTFETAVLALKKLNNDSHLQTIMPQSNQRFYLNVKLLIDGIIHIPSIELLFRLHKKDVENTINNYFLDGKQSELVNALQALGKDKLIEFSKVAKEELMQTVVIFCSFVHAECIFYLTETTDPLTEKLLAELPLDCDSRLVSHLYSINNGLLLKNERIIVDHDTIITILMIYAKAKLYDSIYELIEKHPIRITPQIVNELFVCFNSAHDKTKLLELVVDADLSPRTKMILIHAMKPLSLTKSAKNGAVDKFIQIQLMQNNMFNNVSQSLELEQLESDLKSCDSLDYCVAVELNILNFIVDAPNKFVWFLEKFMNDYPRFSNVPHVEYVFDVGVKSLSSHLYGLLFEKYLLLYFGKLSEDLKKRLLRYLEQNPFSLISSSIEFQEMLPQQKVSLKIGEIFYPSINTTLLSSGIQKVRSLLEASDIPTVHISYLINCVRVMQQGKMDENLVGRILQRILSDVNESALELLSLIVDRIDYSLVKETLETHIASFPNLIYAIMIRSGLFDLQTLMFLSLKFMHNDMSIDYINRENVKEAMFVTADSLLKMIQAKNAEYIVLLIKYSNLLIQKFYDSSFVVFLLQHLESLSRESVYANDIMHLTETIIKSKRASFKETTLALRITHLVVMHSPAHQKIESVLHSLLRLYPHHAIKLLNYIVAIIKRSNFYSLIRFLPKQQKYRHIVQKYAFVLLVLLLERELESDDGKLEEFGIHCVGLCSEKGLETAMKYTKGAMQGILKRWGDESHKKRYRG